MMTIISAIITISRYIHNTYCFKNPRPLNRNQTLNTDRFAALQHLQKLHIKGHQKGINYFVDLNHILLAETNNQYIILYFLHNNKLEHELYCMPMVKFWDIVPHDIFVYDNLFYIINWVEFNGYNIEEHSASFNNDSTILLNKPFDYKVLKSMLHQLYNREENTL